MPNKFDEIVDDLDSAGYLDEGGVEDNLLDLHTALRDKGLDPENPDTYKVIMATITTIIGTPAYGWPLMMNELIRVSARALRDLNRRGEA